LSRLAAAGCGAAGGTGWLSPAPARAQSTVGAGIVDFHHHYIPPFYLKENLDRVQASFGGSVTSAWLTWTPERALEAMDRAGIATSLLSLTTPSVWFGDAQAAKDLARRVNEYAADMVRNYPSRFGLFASIPLPDSEGSLREIEHAFDVLKADGVILLTSYDERYLGHPAYAAVFEELNRRQAIVFVHPTVGPCCRKLTPDVPPVMDEIPQDTSRAISNLLYTGSLARYRGIRFIFTHAGGAMPMAYGRMLEFPPKNLQATAPEGIERELTRLHFDIASAAYRPAIAALTNLVPISQIVFGSDNPYTAAEKTANHLTQLGLTDSQLRAIRRENALSLLPRLQQG
jgi:predicted TIM-barrel fold metal-dependent hydrolase